MPTSWSSADLLLPKGWSVVALGFVTLAFAFTVRGSLSLAMPLWQAEFGWSRSAISSIAAAALLVMAAVAPFAGYIADRSEEHPSELQSLIRTSYACFCLQKKNKIQTSQQ